MPDARIVALVLAAGRSSRFGRVDKLLADLAGTTVLDRVLDTVSGVPLSDVVVVCSSDPVERAVAGRPMRIVRPIRDAMGASIAAGVEAAPSADAWLVWPADMPLIRTETAARVIDAFDPDAPVVPVHRGRRGHPVLFPARYGPVLRTLHRDRGARAVLDGADRVVELEVDDAGIHMDIDTQQDLEKAGAFLR